jgi:tetratricopeptide (TPR) repeat protein
MTNGRGEGVGIGGASTAGGGGDVVADLVDEMNDREPGRTSSNPLMAAIPATPVAAPLPVPAAGAAARVPTPEEAQRARERIDSLVNEARASTGLDAASLWFEAGRLFEYELGDFKNAAGLYQESHKADPQFLPVIHAARRLFAQLGKWGMVVVLIDEEMKLEGAPVTALLVEKARIHENRLARPEDAVALYQQALGVDRGYAPAIDGLVRHLEQKGAWTEIVAVLKAGAAASTRPPQRAAWLLEVGRLSEARLHDDAAAVEAYELAESVVPGRRAVLESLRRLYARKGDVEKLGRILERLAETAGSVSECVTFLCERARMLAASGQERQAVEALEEAREKSPDDPLILGDLALLYERLEMWPSLVETLEAHARGTHDRAELLALFAEAGKLAEEKLQDVERAIRLYGSCVEVDPSYGPALTALGKLFAKTRRYRELARVYDVQIASALDPQHKVNLLFKQAELLADKLSDPASALLRLQEVLKLQPGWVPALKMTSALYARLDRWEDLLATYEAELSSMGDGKDRDQSIFLLEKIASVIEDKLQDPARAVDVYKRMLTVHPGYLPALRSLGRLYARLDRWEDLLAVNAEEAQIVSDQNHIVSLMFKNGEILADKLGRVEDAIGAYRQALALMPNYLPALKALGAIYARAGRHKDLIAMHREEADVARRKEQRAYLLFMVAQILDEKLADTKAATDAYREVLAEDPTYHPAMRALARIASREGDWDGLLKVYEAELSVLSEARDRALLRCRMAEIMDRRLNRVDDAITTLQAAIADSSYLLAAHEQLVSLFARLGRAEDEVKARENMHQVLPDVESRVANLRVLADHALHRLDVPDRALDAAQRILFESGADRSALRLALGCALKLHDYKLAIDLAERLARVEPAADEVANLHLQVAVWKESHIEPAQDALPNYVKALEFDPANPTALRAVERAYVERQAWDGLYALYERERARRTQPEIVADLSMKMGELAERRLQKPETALECYERVLQARPGHIPSITRLKELYGKLGRASDQLRMLSLEAQSSKDPQHAIHTLLEVGALQRDRFGNLDAAIDCFSRVLERDPLHSDAYQSLESLLVTNSRWEDLAKLYILRSGSVAELPQKVELLTKAAHILGDRLKRFGAAAEAYEKVLALVPTHSGALLQLGNLRYALQEWDGAVQAYTQLVQTAGDPMLVVPVHFNLGVIFSEHRPEPQRAIQHLTSCLAMQPDNREARKRLAKSYALAGSPAQALTAYKQLVDTATDKAEKREMHLVLARLFEQSFNDLAQAGAQLEQAMALSDDRAEQGRLLDELAGLYERAGNLPGLIQATKGQAEQLVATDKVRAADLLLRAAVLQIERTRDLEGGTKTARRALEVAPEHVEARAFLADLYARTPNQSLLAVEEYRRILRGGHVRPASIRALFRMWQAQRAHDRCFVAAEILSFLGVSDDNEELFFNDNKKRLKKETAATLDPGQVKGWLLHPAQRNAVHDVLSLVVADFAKPFADGELEPVDKRFVLRPKTDDPVRRLADDVALNLGASGFDVWKQENRRGLVRAYTASPPVLVIGVDVVKLQPTREQRFLVGRELMALMSGHTLIRGMDARALGALVTAIGKNVDKSFPILGDVSPGQGDLEGLTKKVGSALSRKTRGLLAEPVATLMSGPRVDLKAFLDAAPLSEARAGLLLSGAFDAAVRLIAKESGKPLASDAGKLAATLESEPRLADLVSYALTDDHFLARQALRLAIDS